MDNNIKKFEEYTQDPLMDNLEEVKVEEEEFNAKDWEIESVIDVMTEDPTESELTRIDTTVEEAITFDTQVPRDVKRGDYLWITAMITKKNSSFQDPGRQAVIKLRVVDIYNGLSHLNKVLNR